MQGDKYSKYVYGNPNEISTISELKWFSSSGFSAEASLVLTPRYIFNVIRNCRAILTSLK